MVVCYNFKTKLTGAPMKILLIVLTGLIITSCASLLNDDYQRINIGSTNNSELKGSIDGVPFTGPGIITVKRAKADKIIMVDSPACTKQTLLASTVDMKFYINILSGGTTGSTTDYATEKMWKYQDSVLIPCK
jgi:hypothetical protein